MAAPSLKSTLSVGALIRAVLLKHPAVSSQTRIVAPLVVPAETELPYIVYRRAGYSQTAVKRGRGSETIAMEFMCVADSYAGSLALAEALREALDGLYVEDDELAITSSTFVGGSEIVDGEAVVQLLAFDIKVSPKH